MMGTTHSMSPAALDRRAIRPYLALIRAPFLLFTLLVVSVPAAAAIEAGAFDPANTALALGSVLFGHVAVNVLNLVSDYRTGIDEATEETPYSGGNDVLTSGAVTYRRALAFGVGSLLLSGLFVVPLALQFGRAVPFFYAIGAVLVVGYTDVFARVGLGEFACGLGLTFLPTVMVGYVQTGALTERLLYLSVPMFLVGFNLLLLNEFPDVEADRPNGRVNVPIVFGRRRAGQLYVALVGATVASVLYPIAVGALPATVAIAVLPVALLVPVFRGINSGTTPEITDDELGAHILWTQATIATLGAGMLLAAWL